MAFGDEMRVGLIGQVRRRWSPRGVKLRQRVQMKRESRYLALAVDGVQGKLSWTWIESMKGVDIAPAVMAWRDDGIDAIVWDGARGHHGPDVIKQEMVLIQLPPRSPELNPAERVFQEIRRHIEGRIYNTLEQKVRAVETILARYNSSPELVMRLAGWRWIMQVHEQLPRMLVDA